MNRERLEGEGTSPGSLAAPAHTVLLLCGPRDTAATTVWRPLGERGQCAASAVAGYPIEIDDDSSSKLLPNIRSSLLHHHLPRLDSTIYLYNYET